MRKIRFLFIAIIGFVLWSLLNSKTYIKTANEHMDINGLNLMMTEKDLADVIKQEFAIYPGMFGGNRYESKSKGLIIAFSGFPDTADKWVLTDIETTNSEYSFYQINVGDNVLSAEQILLKNGFEVNPIDSNGHNSFHKKSLFVTLDFTQDTNNIKKLIIRLNSTNHKGIVY